MTKIECRFNFHPIGQGLFYSGQVNDFCFVYDCGTDSGSQYAQTALETYPDRDRPLDLLIISHFHADHMNAVKDLLKKCNGVKEVVLPYLFPAERLLAGAGYAITRNLDELDDDYILFLSDPVGYLMQRGANDAQISFVRPGEVVRDWPEPGEQGAGPYGWYPNEPEDTSGDMDAEEMLHLNNVNLRRHSAIRRAPLWGFKFYCQPGRASTEDIVSQLASLSPPIDPADISNVLQNRLDDLKDIYHALFGGSAGQNSTSIVCCHGPAAPRGKSRQILHCEAHAGLSLSPPREAPDLWRSRGCCTGHIFLDWHCHWSVGRDCPFLLPPLQLLTGDANLKASEYQTHFAAELDAIGLALLPHHGSKSNWRKNFPGMLPNCMLWVVSFGLGNRHKHPHKSVVDAVIDSNRQLILSNEAQHVSFHAIGRRLP